MCWTNPSRDEHSCLAQSKAGVNSLEIFIHTHTHLFSAYSHWLGIVCINEQFLQHAPKLVILAVIFKSLLIFKLLSSKRSSSIKFVKHPCVSSHSQKEIRRETLHSPIFGKTIQRGWDPFIVSQSPCILCMQLSNKTSETERTGRRQTLSNAETQFYQNTAALLTYRLSARIWFTQIFSKRGR